MINQIKTYLNKNTSSAPLVVFRCLFGFMMCFSLIRFCYHGWIEQLYITPKFHFTYYGFEWVKPLGIYTYVLFTICFLSALCVALGLKYRLAIVLFFLSFTYIELLDKTTYLNHYYFISILSFLMIFLPANVSFSFDAYWSKKSFKNIPNWTIDSVKLLLGIVYFYAGIAKLNSDWLLEAMPLKIWLPSKYDLPLIGENLMQQEWFHYAMSWSGMLYDITIPFLLLYKRTRWYAFVLVVVFHVFTRILFPIGVFPFIMIVSTLIFFAARFHERILTFIKQSLKLKIIKSSALIYSFKTPKLTLSIVTVFLVIQLLLPFRYLAYPNELFWTEEGYRFSWRVMLMEKAGLTTFKIANTKTGSYFYVQNTDFLTSFQEKQMSYQPDFILEYAHFLGDHFTKQGHKNVAVYAQSYVALNGRQSQPFVNPKVDLYKEKESFKHKNWLLPFNDEIKGL